MMKPKPSLTLDEQDGRVVFRMNLFAEARGEQDSGGTLESEAMLWIGWVVLNRAKTRNLTPKQVILQRLQFSWTRPQDPNYPKVMRADITDPISWERADTVADLIEAGVADPTHGATHYYNPKVVDPPWGRRDPRWRETGTKGNHVFGIAA